MDVHIHAITYIFSLYNLHLKKNSLIVCCEPDHTPRPLPAPCSPSFHGILCSIKHVRVEEDLGATFGDVSLG